MNAAAGNGSRSTSTAEQLRKHILRGLLLPGEHLGQAELATRFSMSKVPVREALKQLCAEGLLIHDHNRGYFVARLSFEEGIQLYRLRRWVEHELLMSLRWPTPEEMNQLKALCGKLIKPGASDDREAWFTALSDLRYSIFSLSPYKTLLSEARRLWTLTDRYRALFQPDRSPTGEKALLEALEAQNRPALLKAYNDKRKRIEAMLAESFDIDPRTLTSY